MNNILKLVLTVFALMVVTTAFAQGPPGPPATPIDSGLSLLLAGGAAYGAKKINDYRRKKK